MSFMQRRTQLGRAQLGYVQVKALIAGAISFGVLGAVYFGMQGTELTPETRSHLSTDETHLTGQSISQSASVHDSVLTEDSDRQSNGPAQTRVDGGFNQEDFAVLSFATVEQYEAVSRYGALPAHMRDVRMEHIAYDVNGQLIVNENLKRVFEFFLMAVTEEGYEQATERLYEYLVLTLPDSASEQAAQIATRYLEYKNNLQDHRFSLASDLGDPKVLNDIEQAMNEKRALRREHLGPEISDALFAHEEAYDTFSLQRIRINGNQALSPEEKDAALAQAEQKLPPQLANKMQRQREEANLKVAVAKLQEEGGREQEIYELRKDFYGESAAERMAFLESNTPEWQARTNQFYQQQADILRGTGSQEDKYALISELKQQMFSKKEQIKLAVQSIRASSS